MAHLLTPPGVHLRRPPLWVRLRCGGCGTRFTGNAFTVPQWRDAPSCRGCWDRLNLMRDQANLRPWETPPDAYLDDGAPHD